MQTWAFAWFPFAIYATFRIGLRLVANSMMQSMTKLNSLMLAKPTMPKHLMKQQKHKLIINFAIVLLKAGFVWLFIRYLFLAIPFIKVPFVQIEVYSGFYALATYIFLFIVLKIKNKLQFASETKNTI